MNRTEYSSKYNTPSYSSRLHVIIIKNNSKLFCGNTSLRFLETCVPLSELGRSLGVFVYFC